jgi:type II secretion system protein C
LTSNTAKQKTIVRLALLISAGVFALVSFQSLGYLLDPFQMPPKPNISNAQAATQPKSKPRNTAVYKHIGNWHLFGMAAKEENKKVTKAIDAPETNLNLSLLGVLFNPNQEESRAIIEEQGKSHKSYKVGDPLPRNATLYSIEAERVILSRNGRHESLKLKKLELPGGQSGSSFHNQRMASPGSRTAKNMRNRFEEHPEELRNANQATRATKPEKAMRKPPAPPSKSKVLQAGGLPQDV